VGREREKKERKEGPKKKLKKRKERKGKRGERKKEESNKEKKGKMGKRMNGKKGKKREKQKKTLDRHAIHTHLLLQLSTHFLLPWLDLAPLFLTRSFLFLSKCTPLHNKYPNTGPSQKAKFVELCRLSSFSYSHSCFQQ
jgi:hypothetical protein